MGEIKKILLVNPACLDYRISSGDAQVVPIGLFTIAALLLENGIDTRILNLAAPNPSEPDPSESRLSNISVVDIFTKETSAFQPDMIGFSVSNPNRWSAVECAKAARQSNPDAKIVFGGPAATFMADHFFNVCPELDYAVIGEGEVTFLELIQSLSGGKSLEHVKGIVFRDEKGLQKTRARPLLENLDNLPHPSGYFAYNHLAMSRGCPGRCTFCGSPKFWGTSKVRFHSPEWFADEIKALNQKGVTHFYISDDTFTSDKDSVLEFCQLIRKADLNITWNAISRVDCIDGEILFAMRTAGCIQISFGVESGSAAIRKTLGKPMKNEQIVKAFKLTRSYGIMPRAYFIYGSPGETDETIEESIKLMASIEPLSAIFYMMVLFPGTRLYDRAVQKGAVTDDIWKQKIEDLPWFEIDNQMNFTRVKQFGDRLRNAFYNNIETFALNIELENNPDLYRFHADFLSRLAMTFSSGEYSRNPGIKTPDKTAEKLFEKALTYGPDPRAFLGLAMLYQKRRQLQAATDLLSKGLQEWPDYTELNICMGVCLMNQGKFDSALEKFNSMPTFPGKNNYISICRQQLTGK